MMSKEILPSLGILAVLVISGCSEESGPEDVPAPIAMSEEAVGHYCKMNLREHAGPKAQIHLKSFEVPIWFSQVRDAIAFMRLPEETQEPVAIYVNDMGKADNWDFPADDTWIEIKTAFFVIGSNKVGGMGVPEAIPFGTQESAASFATEHGGVFARLEDIPDAYVLGPVDLKQNDTVAGAVE